MAQTIKLKRNSENNDTAPVAGDLAVGEIAVNSVSGKLYTKKSDDSVVEISGSGGGGGGGTPELTFTVTVAQVSGANKFHLAGTTAGFATATANPVVDLQRGFTYKFDQSDSSNATHELVITASSTGGSGVTAYTTGVTTTGTVGVDRVLTFVVPHDAADTLYYQCNAHASMGNELDVGDTIIAGATNLPIYDEDELLASSISKLNFTGTGVTATYELESVTTPGDADWAKVTALISGGETVTTTTVPGDSDWDDVVLLIDGNGDVDDETDTQTFTTGNVGTHTTSYKKWGTGSLDFSSATTGTNQKMISFTSDWNVTGTAWTIEAWVYRISATTGDREDARPNIFSFRSGGYHNFGINGTTLYWNHWSPNTTWTYGTVPTETWTHVAATWDTSNFRMYIDGVASSSLGTSITSNLNGSMERYIGQIGYGSSLWNNSYFNGYIDDFRFTFGTARYGASNFSVPTAAFPLGTGGTTYSFPESSPTTPHTVTVKGGQTALDTTTVPAANGSKPTGITYGGAMKFDGTDDYYTIPSDADFAFGAVDGTDNDFTIESWVYLDSTVAGDCVLFDGRTAAANAVVPLLEVKSNKLTYTVNNVALITDSADLTTNTWHHIAIQRSGANTVVSKNGTSIGGTQTASTYIACPWTIGASSASTPAAFFKGWMEEWRVTKGKARYTVTTTSSSTTIDNSGWGGTITTVGDYKLHTFTASGTFNMGSQQLDDIDILVVAGGASGGAGWRGAGGGAGGLIWIADWDITGAYSYSVTIGTGGNAGPNVTSGNDGQQGAAGGDSIVAGGSKTLTAKGGGGGRSNDNAGAGYDGGSGGGSVWSGFSGGSSTQPSNTSDGVNTYNSTGFGNSGGTSGSSPPYFSGGGGAGAAAVAYNTSQAGGAGKDYSTELGTAVGDSGWFAGGGGADNYGGLGRTTAPGGQGGGGTGNNASDTAGADATDGTGGGGGSGGDGGNGVVIFRIPTSDLSTTTTTYSTDYDPSTWTTVFPTSLSTTTTTPTVDVAITGGGSGSALIVKDENTTLVEAATQIGFTGTGVTATGGNNIVTVDVPGGTLPSGGSLGQVLAKSSADSGDAGWIDVSNSATMTNTSTETYFEEVGNGTNVTSTTTTPGDTYWSDVVFFARGSETIASNAFTESSGTTAHTVTLVGGANQTTGTGGKFLEGWNFDGVDDYWTVASDADFGFGAVSGTDGDFTIETWIYADASNTSDFVVFDGRTAAANALVPLLERKSNYLTYTVNGTAFITDPDVLPTDAWTHIAIERSGSHTHLFVDGSLKASKNNDTTTYATCPFRVGASSASTAAYFFKGKMDDFRISKRARYAVTTTTTTGGSTGNQKFQYTGASQSWDVPSGNTLLTVELWGAAGSNGTNYNLGGAGGYAKGDLTVVSGETLYFIVGQGGIGAGNHSGSGGGGSFIYRTNNTTHSNILAAAGGGGGSAADGQYGGVGGGTNGTGGSGPYSGAGTQSAVGNSGPGATAASGIQGASGAPSSSSTGTRYGGGGQGASNNTTYTNGGGGGGYYGGGTGATGTSGGGGGGSGYVGSMANTTLTAGSGNSSSATSGGSGSPNYTAGIGKPVPGASVAGHGEIYISYAPSESTTHSGDFTPTTIAFNTGAGGTTTTTTAIPGDIFYSTGKVGIGTSLPAYDLDVVGNVNYSGSLYQNGELIQPATKTWSNMSPTGATGETDDSVGDNYYNYVQLLLHMNAEGTAYTTVTDHSKVPLGVTFTGDAQLKPVTLATDASGDANWTDVHLLISPRTAAVQDESTNEITITNT